MVAPSDAAAALIEKHRRYTLVKRIGMSRGVELSLEGSQRRMPEVGAAELSAAQQEQQQQE
jgi:hypothetical protein